MNCRSCASRTKSEQDTSGTRGAPTKLGMDGGSFGLTAKANLAGTAAAEIDRSERSTHQSESDGLGTSVPATSRRQSSSTSMQTLAQLSHDLAELARVFLDGLPGLFQAGRLGFLSIGRFIGLGHGRSVCQVDGRHLS